MDLKERQKLVDYEYTASEKDEARKIETKLKMLSVHSHEVKLFNKLINVFMRENFDP